MLPHLLLLLLFVLTIAHLVTLKICSVRLDHRTAPVFVSVWVLAGLAAKRRFLRICGGTGLFFCSSIR